MVCCGVTLLITKSMIYMGTCAQSHFLTVNYLDKSITKRFPTQNPFHIVLSDYQSGNRKSEYI